MFQRLLSESARQKEVNLIEDLKNTSKTLNQLVSYLIDEKSRGNQAIQNILLSTHPVFDEIQRLLEIPYRVFFQNIDELSTLLKARQYDKEDVFDAWSESGFISWKRQKLDVYLRVSEQIFEDGRLKIYAPNEWRKEWVYLEDQEDIPF